MARKLKSFELADSFRAVKFLGLVRQCVHPGPAAAAAGWHAGTMRLWLTSGREVAQLCAGAEGDTTGPRQLPADNGKARYGGNPALASFGRVLRCICAPSADADLWMMCFAEAYAEALGEAEASLVLKARAGANDNPELALRLLGKRFAKRWAAPTGPGAQVNVQGQVGALTIFAPAERPLEGPEDEGEGEVEG